MSRLIEADYNNGSSVWNYGYDVAGNLVDLDGTIRTFNDANQMTNDGTNTLVYDDNGNLRTVGSDTYVWDRANRLLSVGNHSYVYDGAGNRVQQTVSSVVTDYLNDLQPGLTKLLKQDNGITVEHFVHAPRGIHAVDDGTDWNFYAQDGLGSVRALLDDAGAVQSSMSFDPYGMPLGTNPDNFGFTGEQTDENGLNYRRARYYDPTLAMWTAEDFLEMPNRYAYVDGNPVNLIDNNGLQGNPSGVLDFNWWQQGLGGIADDIAQLGDDIARWGAPIGRRIRSAIASRGAVSVGISQLDSPLIPIADFVGLAYLADGIIRGSNVPRAGRASEVPTYDNPSIVGQGSFSGTGVVASPIPIPPNAIPNPERLWRDVQDICSTGLNAILTQFGIFALTSVSTSDWEDDIGSCEQDYPEYETCYDLVGRGGFTHNLRSYYDALNDLSSTYKTSLPDEFRMGNDTDVEMCEEGKHWNVYGKIDGRGTSTFLGTITCCPCCNDGPYGPTPEIRCWVSEFA